jgi:hypothetical protein
MKGLKFLKVRVIAYPCYTEREKGETILKSFGIWFTVQRVRQGLIHPQTFSE